MRASPISRCVLTIGLVVVGLSMVAGAGCGVDDQPEPVKLEQASPYERDVRKNKPSDPNDPLRNPSFEPPAGPDGAQVSAAEIDALVAEAAKYAAVGDVAQQRIVLGKCANKTPPSARCDGELGLSLIEVKNRRAAAVYHLVAAANVDDPAADASLYARVGKALSLHGKLSESVAALERAVARDPSADNTFALGQALSLIPDRLIEAADRIAEARSKDDRIGWLHDEAVIRGQIPMREQAEASLALFRLYLERAASTPPDQLPTPPERLETRLAELEAAAKLYPTQAEWEKKKAEEAAKKGPVTEPTPKKNGPS
jgi:tetratricopeptide (TPR) repeat protein